MGKIRVMVVDDAVVVRRIVTDVLNEDPAIEVAGTAPNGKIALAKLTQVNPDLVTLDVEMPEMDGLETLQEIRKTYPRLPVIMFSTLTDRGGAATLDALALGASDYVTKPANVGSFANAVERIRLELRPKIRTFCRHCLSSAQLSSRVLPKKTATRRTAKPKPIEIVAIGSSTGGPNALADVLPLLPADFPVPIVIVQHMPPLFTRLLAERLDSKCHLHVHEATEGQLVEPGNVYIAPGNFHLEVSRRLLRTTLHLNQAEPENSCRPAADVLFRSVAQNFGAASLGLILTGMGQDGLRGCEAIHDLGGQILAQDEETSVVWGMPGYVAQAGLADSVLPLNFIGTELLRRVRKARVPKHTPTSGGTIS